MRRPQVDKKGRAVSWSFTEVRLESTLQGSHLKKTVCSIHYKKYSDLFKRYQQRCAVVLFCAGALVLSETTDL